MSTEVLSLLCSSQKIERDKGVVELNKVLNTAGDEEVKRLEASLQSLLEDGCLAWESKHGALMGTKTLISHEKCSDEFALVARDFALRLLEHSESRVRLSAGAWTKLVDQNPHTPTHTHTNVAMTAGQWTERKLVLVAVSRLSAT